MTTHLHILIFSVDFHLHTRKESSSGRFTSLQNNEIKKTKHKCQKRFVTTQLHIVTVTVKM